jgi:hypothetical protein
MPREFSINEILDPPEHYKQAQEFVNLAQEKVTPNKDEAIVEIELDDTDYYLDMVDTDMKLMTEDGDHETAEWLKMVANQADIRSATCTDVSISFRSDSSEIIEDLKREIEILSKDYNVIIEDGSVNEQLKFQEIETTSNPEGYLWGMRYTSLMFIVFKDTEE